MDKEKQTQSLTKLQEISQQLIDELDEAGKKRNLCINHLHEENKKLAESNFSDAVEKIKKTNDLEKQWIELAGTILREA